VDRPDYRARVAALPPGGAEATQRALARAEGARALVLVEGFSDEIALETLAARYGRDLAREGVAVIPIGGAQAIRNFAARFTATQIVGLCDENEERLFRRALGGREFFVCHADLEDELIRALGTDAVEAVIVGEGDGDAFRTFRKQPVWRGRPADEQLHRFLGSAGRRKLRYARLLVDALRLDAVPTPLAAVLRRV
jgi:hypothetical protein